MTGCSPSETTDAGRIIVLGDAGPRDAGAPDAGPGDAGRPDGGALCTPLLTRMTSVCAPSTRDCWSACRTTACVDACVAADPSPDCETCFTVNELLCIREAGCETQHGALDCCRQERCPADPIAELGCADGACGLEELQLQQCGLRVGHAGCAAYVSACF